MIRSISIRASAAALALAVSAPLAAQPAPDPAAFYQASCAQCHDGGLDRAPSRDVLRTMSPDRVLRALEFGPMVAMAAGRSLAERRAISEFVTGKTFASAPNLAPASNRRISARAIDATGPIPSVVRSTVSS